MASSNLQTLVDLPKAGYVEEEFFVAGRANVYDWAADGRLSVKTPPRPTRRASCSGVRPTPHDSAATSSWRSPNAARRFDFNFTWGVSHDHLIENGDVFVVVTIAQGQSSRRSRLFDPTRYAPLSMANPTPDEACAAPGRGGGAPQTSPFEEGLQCDILSQVAALLKAARRGGPLAGFNVQRAYMTAYDAIMTNYMAGSIRCARLANGRPVYDGYVQHRHPRPRTAPPLRRPAPAADDPRHIVRNSTCR